MAAPTVDVRLPSDPAAAVGVGWSQRPSTTPTTFLSPFADTTGAPLCPRMTSWLNKNSSVVVWPFRSALEVYCTTAADEYSCRGASNVCGSLRCEGRSAAASTVAPTEGLFASSIRQET